MKRYGVGWSTEKNGVTYVKGWRYAAAVPTEGETTRRKAGIRKESKSRGNCSENWMKAAASSSMHKLVYRRSFFLSWPTFFRFVRNILLIMWSPIKDPFRRWNNNGWKIKESSVRNITDDLNQKGFKSISKSDFDFDLNHLKINDLKPRFTAV